MLLIKNEDFFLIFPYISHCKKSPSQLWPYPNPGIMIWTNLSLLYLVWQMIAWPNMEKTPKQYHQRGIRQKTPRSQKIRVTTAQLEKNKNERSGKYWKDLKWGKKNDQKQSNMENDCINPMFHKEPVGSGNSSPPPPNLTCDFSF